jgi:hypothetical protein
MQSKAFIKGIQKKLEPIAPVILPKMIKKQLEEVGATEDTLTPEAALKFIDRMEIALEMFLGQEGKKIARQVMLKELRKYAPEYFKEHSAI